MLNAENTKNSLKYDKNNKYHRLIRAIIITFSSLIILLLIWWNLSLFLRIPAIPTPARVWDAFISLFSNGDPITGFSMWKHISSSLIRFAWGFLIAFAIAVPFGLLLGYSETLRNFSNPAIEILRPIAPIAWAPVFVLSIGLQWGAILVVTIGIFFPLLTNTAFGVKKIDPIMLDASRTLGANKFQQFYKVMFPCAVPYIMNGIRIGLGIGWMCIVAAEMYAGGFGGGIGFFISLQASLALWPNVFVGIGVIAVLGILTTGVADYAYRKIAKGMGME